MAMFPNATRGYMPFVSENSNASKKSPKKIKKPKKKTYQVTLRDKNGFIYTYLIKTDGTQSLPELLDSKISGTSNSSRTHSLPNIGMRSPTRIPRNVNKDEETDEDKKGGLLSSFIKFLKQKAGKGGKSKRKSKPMVQRKRIRTVSAMSNLDPIQESPEEDDDDNNDDDSYTHSDSGCDTASEASFSDSLNDSASIKSIKSSEVNEDGEGVITNEP